MRKLILKKEDTYQGTLILISPEYPIAQICRLGEMVPVGSDRVRSADILLQAEAADMFDRLLAHIRSGDRIVPVSGFRSHAKQVQIWEETMEKEGEVFTRKYVAKPGHSEHESGLAIDLAQNREEIDFICPEFPDTGVCKEFRRAASSYGFVERYPSGKERITGIGAEPWHFRYVGRPHALVMSQEKLVLEEYIAFLREETSLTRPFCHEEGNRRVEISYIDMRKQEEALLEVLEDMPYHISGTNEGGIIFSRQSPAYA